MNGYDFNMFIYFPPKGLKF